MTDETLKLTPFETLVLQRLDQIDQRLDQIDERLDKLEAKTYDTKPIWEQALAEILEVKAKVTELEKHMQDVDHSLVAIHGALYRFDERITVVENR